MLKFIIPLVFAIPASVSANESTEEFCERIKSEGLYQVDAEVIKVEPLCPKNAVCIVDGTMITVKFYMKGCFDTLNFDKDFNYIYQALDNKLHVDVQAFAFNNPESENVFCFVPNTAKETIVLINEHPSKGEIQINNVTACKK